MLQQTQVDRVIPRYKVFLERWPTIDALAAASAGDVIAEWQGLGYNRRAVNLHRAARVVAAVGWPEDLTVLPGVGPYTAAAIGNFAFGHDVLPVDTNAPASRSTPRVRRLCSTSVRRSVSRACPGAASARSPSSAGRAAVATSRCAGSHASTDRSASGARMHCVTLSQAESLATTRRLRRSSATAS